MILTRDFVYVHVPKTGGTFVTSKMTQALEARDARRNPLLRGIDRLSGKAGAYEDVDKHGSSRDIPRSHWHKPRVACVRGPYERYHSQWRFGWWRETPPGPVQEVREVFPSFPELTFEQWFRMTNRFWRAQELPDDRPDHLRPGLQTRHFLWYFAKDPTATLARVDLDDLPADLFRDELFATHWLHTERLNQDLHAFLLGVGCNEQDLAGLLGAERIQPPSGGRAKGERWQEAYTPELLAEVRRREALIFALFPEYDVQVD